MEETMIQPEDETPERVEEVDMPITPPPENKNSRLMQVLMIVVISAAVVFAMNNFVLKTVSFTDFDTNIKNIASDLKTVKESTTQLDSLQQQLTKVDTKDVPKVASDLALLTQKVAKFETLDLSSYAKASELTAIKESVNNLANNSTVKNLQDQVKALSDANAAQNTAIANLKAEIEDLKVTPTQTVSGGSGDGVVYTSSDEKLEITVKDLGTEILKGSYGFDGSDSIKVTVRNGYATSLSDLRLMLYLETLDYNLPAKYIASDMEIQGDIGSSLRNSSSSEFEFRTDRITVPALKTKTYYLTPHVVINPEYPYLVCSTYRIGSDPETDVSFTNNRGSYLIGGVRWYYAETLPDSDILNDYYKVIDGSSTSTAYGCPSMLPDDICFDVTFDVIDYNIN